MVRITSRPAARRPLDSPGGGAGSSSISGGATSALASTGKPGFGVGLLVGLCVCSVLFGIYEGLSGSRVSDLPIILTTTGSENTSPSATTAKETQAAATTTTSQKKAKKQTNGKPREHKKPYTKPLLNLSSSSNKYDIFQILEAEQTGRLVGPRTDPPIAQREAYFLDRAQLSKDDANSASWIQRTVDFKEMRLNRIRTPEDAATLAYYGGNNNDGDDDERFSKLRMSLDWLDCGVEFLPGWWQLMGVFEQFIPYETLTSKLQRYISNIAGGGSPYKVGQNPPFQQAIAVIPFAIYTKKHARPEHVTELNLLALAATIESIRRAGFGRVVVVGMGDNEEEKVALQAIEKVRKQITATTMEMEMTFTKGSSEVEASDNTPILLPKVALMGLQKAFQIAVQIADEASKDASRVSEEQKTYLKAWLGETENPHSHWQYVALLEPGNILQTRPSTLQQLKAQIDQGAVLVPHRLLTIPSETDVENAKRTDLYLPREGDFWETIDLDANDIHPSICCDEHKGPDFKPGKPPNFPDCDEGNNNNNKKPWYMCQFGDPDGPPQEAQRHHERLKPYKLIRLTQGSGLALLASTRQGRRCIPEKNLNIKICKPP